MNPEREGPAPPENYDHVLYKRRTRIDFEVQYAEPHGELKPSHEKTQAFEFHYNPRFERTSMTYCTCGKRFRSDERAIEHIEEHGDTDVITYDAEVEP